MVRFETHECPLRQHIHGHCLTHHRNPDDVTIKSPDSVGRNATRIIHAQIAPIVQRIDLLEYLHITHREHSKNTTLAHIHGCKKKCFAKHNGIDLQQKHSQTDRSTSDDTLLYWIVHLFLFRSASSSMRFHCWNFQPQGLLIAKKKTNLEASPNGRCERARYATYFTLREGDMRNVLESFGGASYSARSTDLEGHVAQHSLDFEAYLTLLPKTIVRSVSGTSHEQS